MIDNVRAIADAVLYEGFLLFPYSKDALKNRQRWQFGVIMPRGYADCSEPTFMETQLLACHPEHATHLDGASVGVHQDVLKPTEGGASLSRGHLKVLIRFLQQGDPDPVEREVRVNAPLCEGCTPVAFELPGGLRGTVVLRIMRDEGYYRLTLRLRNATRISPDADRNQALRSAFISAHAMFTLDGGVFVSLLDPPQRAKAAAARCRNERIFPVLAGEPADDTNQTSPMALASPIILYDFPRIARTSPARTFDGTEIDELLMLSVHSLSEQEKAAARAAHPYVRELVERAEALDSDTLSTLHGELTGGATKPGEETVTIDGVQVGRGSRVRVQPKGRADVWDDIVRGMTARVNAVHTDFEGKRYVGVVFDADPAADVHEWYGRSFFYGPDELVPLP